MMSFEHTPMPLLPSFGDATPMTPKRPRKTSATLSRRVRANLNELSIPDIHSGSSSPLKLMPQGSASFGGLSLDKILLNGAMRNKQQQQQKKTSHVIAPLAPKTTNVVSSPPRKQVLSPSSLVKKSSPLRGPNNSLMALRMAAMVKGSADTKAQLMFGGKVNKSFELPGRARSSPYRPLVSRALPLRNRSFNAICA